MYFEDREEIKWSIEEALPSVKPKRGIQSRPKEIGATEAQIIEPTITPGLIMLTQTALTLVGFDPGPIDGVLGRKTEKVIGTFRSENQLPSTGVIDGKLVLLLVNRLNQLYPDNPKVGEVSELLLSSTMQISRTTGNTVEPVESGEIIEAHIDGEFEGWDGETIFKLDNGQIWQQDSYSYTYHYAYRPKTLIVPSNAGYRMIVEGVSDSITVRRLK